MSEITPHKPVKTRLQFIDMARSIAIIMMLEGHFTGAALGNAYRNDAFLPYKIWHNLHGLTSPLFFTVTGLVFVYLLCKEQNTSYFESDRVQKGYKRVRMLLFWGYFIQLDFYTIFRDLYYGFKNVSNGYGWNFTFHFEWFQAFHVLQSIGIGILFLLVIYGVHFLIGKGQIHWYFLIAGLLVFVAYSQLKNYIQIDEMRLESEQIKSPHYWPPGFPPFIQNMFYGKFSDFSILRYSGYVILGGMVGSIIRKYEEKCKEFWFAALFIIVGILLNIFVQKLLNNVDQFTEFIGLTDNGVFSLTAVSFMRFGQVISLLGILMIVDSNFKIKAGLFLKLGQNTLPIYIVHVIILYGGIFGFGLVPNLFDRNLNPIGAICISITAILAFVAFIKYIEPLEVFYNRFLNKISPKRGTNHFSGD
jgi:hypothetical protein